jgi:hypothetical protein
MTDLVFVGVCALLALIASHFLLSWAEARGWIYYRRAPRHGGSAYHLMQMSAVFDPKFRQVIEIMVEDERAEDESGDPPSPLASG